MTNSFIKIVCSSGELLDTSPESLEHLKIMGYRTDKDKKLDMKSIGDIQIQGIIMDDISLLINRSETSVKIIAHTHGKRREDKRENRYYFLYNANNIDTSVGLLDILKDFIYKAVEESKKYNFDIIKDNKESLSLFDNLYKITNGKSFSVNIDKDYIDIISSYKGQPQFEAGTVDDAINFFIGLYSKIGNKNICYILYVPKRSNVAKSANTINVYINQDRPISGIEPIKEFNTYLQNDKRIKAENETKNKIRDVQNEIEPRITNSRTIWKNKRKDLEPELRRRLAENLHSIVTDFINDIESEISLFRIGPSKDPNPQPKVSNKVSNKTVGINKLFVYLILLLLATSIGFVSGTYIESHKIDIPYIHGVDRADITTPTPSITKNVTQTPSNTTEIPTIVSTSPSVTPTKSPEVTPTKSPNPGGKNYT